MKGAIFDVDGTLLDSLGMWTDVVTGFFAAHGVSESKETADRYRSMSFEESLDFIHRRYLPDIPREAMARELIQNAYRAYAETVPEKPGACEYVRSLHEAGVRIAIATSGFAKLCQAAFGRLGILDTIDTYAFSSEVGCGKTEPDVYLLAARRLGLDPADCTVFEDLPAGIESAKRAGFSTVAVYDGTNARDKDWLLRHSDRYITGWTEMLSK